jgi:hypothetical protein
VFVTHDGLKNCQLDFTLNRRKKCLHLVFPSVSPVYQRRLSWTGVIKGRGSGVVREADCMKTSKVTKEPVLKNHLISGVFGIV